jgi:sterol desaturase/sphingolipid hydroxylase (fatty acid hydroxylase superfamily)
MNVEKFVYILLDNAFKYFLISLPFFLLFYVLLKKRISYKKIQLKFPRSKDYLREIFFSGLSVFIFSIPPLLMLYSDTIRPLTTFYKHIDEHSTVYFMLAFPLMLIMHDTYFYWAHRAMHYPAIFKLVHLTHHKSTNPSPWAAYAFHPLEAAIESLIFVIFLFLIPMHSVHLTWFFVVSLVYNVYGHLGFEIYPKGFNKHWLGKWMNTSVAHNQHHQYFKGNYGLYFTFWDRWMGTIRTDYDTTYEQLKERTKPQITKQCNVK